MECVKAFIILSVSVCFLLGLTEGDVLEGYLMNNKENIRCLGHIANSTEGTFNVSGDPWDDPNCDMLILEPTENATLTNGSFTMRLAETGVYLGKEGKHIGFFNTNTYEFLAVDSNNRTVGVIDLLDSTEPKYLHIVDDPITSCLYDYLYGYNYLKEYAISPPFCSNPFWFFLEAPVTTSTSEEPASSSSSSTASTEESTSSSDSDEMTTQGAGSLADHGATHPAFVMALVLVAALK